MSVTLQLSLLHLTNKFSLDESFVCLCLLNDLLFELNEIFFLHHNKQRCYKLNILQYKTNTYASIKQTISTITEPYTL